MILDNEDAATTFGPSSPAPYLARTLTAAGAFAPGYYGIGHNSLDNRHVRRLPLFVDVLPGTPAADGQVVGQGCVYPPSVETVAGQLQAKGLTWKGYMEDMGADPVRDNGTACPLPQVGTPDRTQQASAADPWRTAPAPREQPGDRVLVALDKARARRVIGPLMRRDDPERHVFLAGPLDRARRADRARVRGEQQGHHHRRLIRRPAAPVVAVRGIERVEVSYPQRRRARTTPGARPAATRRHPAPSETTARDRTR
jgi:hypothetical protein